MRVNEGASYSTTERLALNGSRILEGTSKGSHSRRDVLCGAIALGTLVPGLSACGFYPLTWTYRYRLRAELETSGYIYGGSSVIEVVRERGYNGIDARVRGEAAYIEVPGAKSPLFFLMYNRSWGVNWPYTVPHYAFRGELGSTAMADPKILDRIVRMNGVKNKLSSDILPLIVTFDDPKDSRTVKEVTPNKLANLFGTSCKLRSVSLELTKDPIEHKIQSALSWLKPGSDGSLDPVSPDGPLGAPLPLSKMIGPRQFIKI